MKFKDDLWKLSGIRGGLSNDLLFKTYVNIQGYREFRSVFNWYGELIMQTPFIIADELHTVVITGWNWLKFIISVVSADCEYQEAVDYDPDVV
jgi:hypothetical protein